MKQEKILKTPLELQSACGCLGEPFALQVLGDSMYPEFKEGDIIVIEPDGLAKNGSFVLAEYQGAYIFRRLIIEEGRYYLTPMNPWYPTVEAPNMQCVRGIVISGGGVRRKDRKRYC